MMIREGVFVHAVLHYRMYSPLITQDINLNMDMCQSFVYTLSDMNSNVYLCNCNYTKDSDE